MKNKKWTNKQVGEKEKRIYNTKAKKLKRKKQEWGILGLFLGLAVVIILGYSNIDEGEISRNLHAKAQSGIDYQLDTKNASEAQILPNFSSWSVMKKEVMALITEAGLDTYEAYSIIQCESKWNPDVVSRVNTNGSQDFGLWQINSIHKDISNLHKLDYIKSTKWAIAKRLDDGNWNSWVCSNKIGL